MSTFRVNKNINYTVMSNYHLQDKKLSLKAKGLLSYQEHYGLSAHHNPERPYHDGALLSGAGQLVDSAEQVERTIAGLAELFPAPDKERSQLLWAAHMNGLKAQAEEVVVREIVYAE